MDIPVNPVNQYLEDRAHDLGYWVGVHFWWAFLIGFVVLVVALVRQQRRLGRWGGHSPSS